MLTMLLKEMRQTLEPDGMFPGDTGDVQGGLFDMFMSRHLADSGGVGLADAIVRQLRPPGATDPVIPADANRPAIPPAGIIPGPPPG